MCFYAVLSSVDTCGDEDLTPNNNVFVRILLCTLCDIHVIQYLLFHFAVWCCSWDHLLTLGFAAAAVAGFVLIVFSIS